MTKLTTHSYFVVAIDYGKRGVEAVVDPEVTRREVVARIKSHEYQNIVFIHSVNGSHVEDVTSELIDEAEVELKREYRDRQADAWDRARDLRNEVVS